MRLARRGEIEFLISELIACRLLSFFILLLSLFGLASQDKVEAKDEGRLLFSTQKPLRSLEAFKASIGMGKQVAVPWWQLYASNICSLNPDGTDLKQLTDDGISRRPEWSPDGKLIAYISGIGEDENLYVMQEDGSQKRVLLERQIEIKDFWWSPDSYAILVAVNTKKITDPMENWMVSIDGESKKRLGYSKWATGWNHWHASKAEIVNPNLKLISSLPKGADWPEWTPDGKYIAFITRLDGERRVAVAEVGGVISLRQWFSQLAEPPCDKIFEWTLDGKKILFSAASRICSAELRKGKLENFINLSGAYGNDATWNPDGSRVAFVKGEPGRNNTEIYIVDADGSNSMRITNTNYNHGELDWK